MLHTPIAIPAKERMPEEKASFNFASSKWGKKRGRRLYKYQIYLPRSRPFLPGTKELDGLLLTIPTIRMYYVERSFTHDALFVYGENWNIFTARTAGWNRQIRTTFLREIAALALAERPLSEHVKDACALFCKEHGFVDVLWTGKGLEAYDANQYRHTSLQYIRLSYANHPYNRAFRSLMKVCATELPFYYEAAPS